MRRDARTEAQSTALHTICGEILFEYPSAIGVRGWAAAFELASFAQIDFDGKRNPGCALRLNSQIKAAGTLDHCGRLFQPADLCFRALLTEFRPVAIVHR